MKHPLLHDEQWATSFTARLYFYQIWGTYHFVQGDMEQAYQFNRKRIDLFHDMPGQIQRMPDRYLSAMNNFLVDCLKLGRETEFRQSLAFIRKVADDPAIRKVSRLPGEIFRLTYMLELNQHVNAGMFLQGMEIIPEVEKGLEMHQSQITAANRTVFYYLVAYTYFGVGRYSQALKWLNRLLQAGEKDSLQHIHATARLFNLILHYEMGNLDLLESMIRSTQRYLQHIDELYELESLFIRAFRQVIHAVSERETREIWKGLGEGMQLHADDPMQNQLLQYFDFQGWLQAKVAGEKFGQA
jgi:tetratricopeptide (TPR) repeat protein